MLGIINLYKPVGKTSHDMVYFIRRTLGIKRVGHTGTLDPCAEGVLPVLVGRATALSDFLMAGDKIYTATVKLGLVTDTYDLSGEVLLNNPVDVSLEDILKAVDTFKGEIMQVPPMYSAIKIDGRKLYHLAREGKEIERPERKISIYDIDVFDYNKENDEFKMRVHCSKGTYIRSLCYDIGKALGCGASMRGLIRNKTGIFDEENSWTPEMIEKAMGKGDMSFLAPPDSVLTEFPAINVDDENAKKIKNGIMLRINQIGLSGDVGQKFRIYNGEEFLCLVKIVSDNGTKCIKIDMGFY